MTKKPKSPKNDCYLHIPCSVATKASQSATERLRIYLCTTFAGNPEGRKLDMAVEALAFHGQPIPQKMIVFVGDGGVFTNFVIG